MKKKKNMAENFGPCLHALLASLFLSFILICMHYNVVVFVEINVNWSELNWIDLNWMEMKITWHEATRPNAHIAFDSFLWCRTRISQLSRTKWHMSLLKIAISRPTQIKSSILTISWTFNSSCLFSIITTVTSNGFTQNGPQTNEKGFKHLIHGMVEIRGCYTTG